MNNQDVKILQKVGAVQREAFREKFPGQCEHILRLTAERLQAVLTKRANTDVANPETWACSARDIADLAIALSHIYEIEQDLKRIQRIQPKD
jgi:hypothetical protein